jgi:hypothetical protein
MRSVKIALGVALALVLVAVGVVLSRSPLTVAGANAVQAPLFSNGTVAPSATRCQAAGTVPRGTRAIRISLGANIDPRITVRVTKGSRLITQGARGPEGGLNASATVPVASVSSTTAGAELCVTLAADAEAIGVRGLPEHVERSGVYGLGDIELRTEYLRPAQQSWWSRISSIAARFGLGRAAGGTWIGIFVLALMLGVAALAARLTLWELR